VSVVAAPGIEADYGASHTGYAFFVFFGPALLATLVESPIAAMSDRLDRARLLRVSSYVLAASLVFCALARAPWQLTLALASAGASSGVACASSQSALVVIAKGETDQIMARWMAAGALGDALVALLVGGVHALGGSYKTALVLVAIAVALGARSTPPVVEGEASPEEEEHVSLRAVLGEKRVWALLLGVTACSLLDEIVLAIFALRMSQDLHHEEGMITACITACSVGSLFGATLTERALVSFSARRVLVASASVAACAIVLAAYAEAPRVHLFTLFVLGVAAAPHYPLLMAAAFDVARGRPGLVHAMSNLLVVIDLALPLLVGLVATHAGLVAAMLVLVLQPLTVGVLALAVHRPHAS
jgi:MFS family permease